MRARRVFAGILRRFNSRVQSFAAEETMARAMAIACCALILAPQLPGPRGRGSPAREAYTAREQRVMNGDYRGPCATTRRWNSLSILGVARQAGRHHLFVLQSPRANRCRAADHSSGEPENPRVDYAMYVKGLAISERMPNFSSAGSTRNWRTATGGRAPLVQSFQTLIERFPQANTRTTRATMIFLAEPPRHVRGARRRLLPARQAWVAAVARARYCIENYDGAPAIRDALDS